ncbi:hypothetical protein B590_28734 [Streptomyces sp. PVA_94-07]|nr:hypothetical protein B590_28734 [Streptomyces sp. PVA_94-07]
MCRTGSPRAISVSSARAAGQGDRDAGRLIVRVVQPQMVACAGERGGAAAITCGGLVAPRRDALDRKW